MAEGSSSTSTATFHGWKYSHYFVIIEEGEKNLRVRCTLCPGNKTLSSARNTTSNFKKHLNTVHKHTVLVEKEVQGPNERGKRKRPDDSEASEMSQPKKQCTLVGMGVPSTRLRNLLSEYVIEDMLPLSTVESAAFRKLIGGICSTQVPDRKSFTAHMDKLYDAMVTRLKRFWIQLILSRLQQTCGQLTTGAI